MDTYEYEALKNGFKVIAGIDEAGRGPLAGPVVAGAVIFPFDACGKSKEILNLGINDSKKLTPLKRENLSAKIFQNAVSVGIGIAWTDYIEETNINIAAQKAMIDAVFKLMPHPDFLLIDGKYGISCNIPQLPVVKGDSLSVSIAAASIIAKVARDRIMSGYHNIFPDYMFEKHKGYGTAEHFKFIRMYGPSPIHRKDFSGVKGHL